jgi:WD40 repeat protein
VLANLATYAVLAPLYYYATKPGNQIREFTQDTHWTRHPTAAVLFVDVPSRTLKSVHLDGSGLATVIPFPTTDYLVSSNLSLCLFRGTNGNLYFYRPGMPKPDLVWQTDERFLIKQAAFSPSGKYIAYASKQQNAVDLLEVANGKRTHLPLVPKFDFNDPLVAWSPNEDRFYVGGLENKLRLAMSVQSDGKIVAEPTEGTNALPVLVCYGRIGTGSWWGGEDWGVSYSEDQCGNLKAMAWPGLDSGVYISRENGKESSRILSVSVRPGLLHLAGFYFGDVGFVEGCDECLFEANGYVYLLDVEARRLGTLVKGDRFIQLTARYEKRL